jgi:hypothetical protein
MGEAGGLGAVVVVVLVLAVAGCDSDESPGEAPKPLPQGSEPASLDPEDFSTEIDNPYWPMPVGARWTYREAGEGAVKKVVVTVTDARKVVDGVSARVVHDVVTEGGRLVEDTRDWYAQDRDGNVWYLGEDTKEYAKGKPPSTAGSWEAGVDGAQAGVIMPAQPRVGLRYRQEHYEGEAEDAAEVLSVDAHVAVPFGSYDGALMTRDYTPLEPDATERKYYVEGVGPVLSVAVKGGGREALVAFTR